MKRLRQYQVFMCDSRGNLLTGIGLAQGYTMNASAAIVSRFWGDTKIRGLSKVKGAAPNTYLVELAGSAPGYYRAVLAR